MDYTAFIVSLCKRYERGELSDKEYRLEREQLEHEKAEQDKHDTPDKEKTPDEIAEDSLRRHLEPRDEYRWKNDPVYKYWRCWRYILYFCGTLQTQKRLLTEAEKDAEKLSASPKLLTIFKKQYKGSIALLRKDIERTEKRISGSFNFLMSVCRAQGISFCRTKQSFIDDMVANDNGCRSWLLTRARALTGKAIGKGKTKTVDELARDFKKILQQRAERKKSPESP